MIGKLFGILTGQRGDRAEQLSDRFGVDVRKWRNAEGTVTRSWRGQEYVGVAGRQNLIGDLLNRTPDDGTSPDGTEGGMSRRALAAVIIVSLAALSGALSGWD